MAKTINLLQMHLRCFSKSVIPKQKKADKANYVVHNSDNYVSEYRIKPTLILKTAAAMLQIFDIYSTHNII